MSLREEAVEADGESVGYGRRETCQTVIGRVGRRTVSLREKAVERMTDATVSLIEEDE